MLDICIKGVMGVLQKTIFYLLRSDVFAKCHARIIGNPLNPSDRQIIHVLNLLEVEGQSGLGQV